MRRASLAALILGAGAVIPGAALHGVSAQGLSDSVLTAIISQSLEVDSNYGLDDPSPGTTIFGDTRLELGLVQETDTDSLFLGFDTALRALDEAGEPFEFTLGSPTGAVFDYARENANSAFDTLLRYRQRRTDFLLDVEEVFGPGVIIEDGVVIDPEDGFVEGDLNEDDFDADAREHRYDVGFGLALNTSAPSSYGLRFTGTVFDYSDDASNLVPRRSGEIAADWTLRFSPVLSTIVLAEYFQYDADNDQETEIQIAEIDAGLVYEPGENLRLRGGVGYAEREKTQTVGGERVTEKDTGPTLRGDVRYIQDAVTLFGDARLTTAAPETRLSFNLRGNYALARGRLTGRVFNRYTGASSGGDEARVSGIGIGLERDINTVSRLGFELAAAYQENVEDEDDPDITNASFSAVYSYDLTRLVTAEIGYVFRNRVEDPDDAISNRVFVNIGRRFETGL